MKRALLVAALGLGCARAGTPPARPSPPAPPSAPAPPTADPTLARSFFPFVQRMVTPGIGGAPAEIVATAGPVRGWAAAAVTPPYREFPTVVLFRVAADGSWQRVFEGFIPGVQGKPTSLLDLHTKGMAFDYTVGEDGALVTPDVIKKILAVSTSKGISTVAHAYFFHGHQAGPEQYFVDRTATYGLAKHLFPGEYETYDRTGCMMFDVPLTKNITLAARGEGLVLVAETANGQTWTFGWTDVDETGLLVGKTVDAR